MMSLTKSWLRLIPTINRPRELRPTKTTWAIAGTALTLASVEAILTLAGPVGAMVFAVTFPCAFLVRRVYPTASIALLAGSNFAIDMTAFALQRPIEIPDASIVVGLATLFSLVRGASRRIILAVAFTALVVIPSGEFSNPGDEMPAPFSLFVSILEGMIFLGAALTVRFVDAGKDKRTLIEETNERNHLANNIHDSVAHHMSAIAIRAEAALQYSTSNEAHDALLDIKRSASTGLSDMRHLVTNLRHDSPDGAPLPGLGEIRQLATESTTPHLVVTAIIDADAEIVPLTVSTTAYAISRGALTNVHHHAIDASRVEISIRHTGPTLEIRISDNGATPLTAFSSGNGLISMNQRAEAVGGILTAGPNPNGGWLVAVQLPINPVSK